MQKRKVKQRVASGEWEETSPRNDAIMLGGLHYLLNHSSGDGLQAGLSACRRFVLIGKEWKTRALLRAQLLEEGIEVRAYETVADALESVAGNPALIIADVASSDSPAAELDQLAHWARFIPTWVLASLTLPSERAVERSGFERVIFRPIAVGDLVAQIKTRLKHSDTH